jgi:hypothetical protein
MICAGTAIAIAGQVFAWGKEILFHGRFMLITSEEQLL